MSCVFVVLLLLIYGFMLIGDIVFGELLEIFLFLFFVMGLLFVYVVMVFVCWWVEKVE